jgi:hypothetical protein
MDSELARLIYKYTEDGISLLNNEEICDSTKKNAVGFLLKLFEDTDLVCASHKTVLALTVSRIKDRMDQLSQNESSLARYQVITWLLRRHWPSSEQLKHMITVLEILNSGKQLNEKDTAQTLVMLETIKDSVKEEIDLIPDPSSHLH